MIKNISKKRNISLKNYCTFKTGGKAKIIYFPKNQEQFIELFLHLNNKKKKLLILGNGSNVLFSDAGFDGNIICTKMMKLLTFEGNQVCVEAGVNLFELCLKCADHGLSGFEKLYGIPGTLGGAVAMNAGAFGSEICDHLKSIKVLKAGKVIERRQLQFAYRQGPLDNDEILLSAEFDLNSQKKEQILAIQSQIFEKRKLTQPHSYPSAGSFFKRGSDFYPAKLIDEWGLKGLQYGGAAISDQHAGFIINKGNACSEDVLKLAKIIEEFARLKGYEFEREVKVIY